MRLGDFKAELDTNSLAFRLYKTKYIVCRHRHRYEIDIRYKENFEKNGMYFSGISIDGQLPEIIEIKDHPFFIGTQGHPEFNSRPFCPEPLFVGLIKHSHLKMCLVGFEKQYNTVGSHSSVTVAHGHGQCGPVPFRVCGVHVDVVVTRPVHLGEFQAVRPPVGSPHGHFTTPVPLFMSASPYHGRRIDLPYPPKSNHPATSASTGPRPFDTSNQCIRGSVSRNQAC